MLNTADLILFVIDSSKDLEAEDMDIYNNINSENVIGIINKIDIGQKIDLSRFSKNKKMDRNFCYK